MSLKNFLFVNHSSNPEMNEIVFEKRNKNYGAYILRQKYPKHLIWSMVISLLIILVLIFSKILFDKFFKEEPISADELVMAEYQLPEYLPAKGPPAGVKKEEVKTEKLKPVKEKTTKKTSETPKVAKENPVEEKSDQTEIEDSDQEEGNSGKAETGTGTGDEIFGFVSNMPLFPGCENVEWGYSERKKCSDKKLRDFLKYNLRYPALALKNKTEGTVLVQFIVEKNGYVSDVKILQDIGDGCGAEARRVVEMMNNMNQRWSPGLQKGQVPVRVQYTLPVVFIGR